MTRIKSAFKWRRLRRQLIIAMNNAVDLTYSHMAAGGLGFWRALQVGEADSDHLRFGG